MIKFIYFDLGGVVIKDFSKTNKWIVMKSVMGVNSTFEKEFDDLFFKYEKEELCLSRNVDTLIPIFKKKFGMNFPSSFSMLDYFVDHFESNPSIIPILNKVKNICKIGILTNMYIDMFKKIIERGLLPPVEWDVVIDSSKVGLQKPDKKIYLLAQRKSGTNHINILFINNNQENLDSATKLGWQTFFYDSSNHEKSCQKLNKLLDNI